MKKQAVILGFICALASNNVLMAEPQLSPDWKLLRAKEELDKQIDSFRATPAPGRLIKIGDLTEVVGEESVMFSGFGVVSGLNGTGDSSVAARELLSRVADSQGIQIKATDLKGQNLAVVSISAQVGPHQKLFDIAVKSIGDAKSLQNGFLEASTLSPIGSSEVYGLASGPLSLGARYFDSSSSTGTGGAAAGRQTVTIGHPTMGFVISGGELTKDIPSVRLDHDKMTLFIKHANDRTAMNIARTINQYMGKMGIEAEPTNASTITISVPAYYHNNPGRVTQLVADIDDLPVTVSRRAIITIDQGSGVIAMTEGVKIEPGSITIAGITVSVSSEVSAVSKGGVYGGTQLLEQPDMQIKQDKANFLSIPAGTDLRKVQETFNAMKLEPTTMISVFNAMHKAGMIHAELVILPQ